MVYTTNDHEGENSHNSTVNDGWTSYLSSVIRKWKRIWSRFPCRAEVSDSITLIISYFLYHLAISWATVPMRSESLCHAVELFGRKVFVEAFYLCYLIIVSLPLKRKDFIIITMTSYIIDIYYKNKTELLLCRFYVLSS